MKTLLAIDPGKTHYGVAYFYGDSLRVALLVGRDQLEMTGHGAARVVIEKPQIYLKREIDVNDLVEVALAAGEARQYFRAQSGAVDYVWPATWKGQTPKTVSHKRIKAELDAEEHKRVQLPRAAKTLGHNVWDAIGIGLWAVGRMKRNGR